MIWKLKPKAPEEFIRQFPEYSPLVLQLLWDRGLKTQAAIDEFFNPDYEQDLHDPFLMLGMKEAVERINKAIERQEKIIIFGDYDADGVCGTVILKTILEALGANFGGVEIPDRKNEGYGLNFEVVKKIAAEGAKLIITVDCGITDIEEILLASSLGLEVIVVDHHEVGKNLPKPGIIIDSLQKGDKYPFKELAGAGVAFKLTQALIQDLRAKNKKLGINDGWEKWLLDLVALATVADCMPLIGENRTLVRYGLIVLAQTQRVGLQELMKIARLNPTFEIEGLKTNLDTYSLGFVLAPRLNVAGRIDHANLAYQLLIAKDRQEAQIMAQKINDYNRLRQKTTDEIVAEIEQRIKQYPKDKNYSVIVEADKNWSPGLIGLVAGKIADRYHRPTFIFNQKGNFSRGSARSIKNFNLVEAIGECADLLIEFGGHPSAAGLELENKNLELFRQRINEVALAKLSQEDFLPSLEIDGELEPDQINWELFDNLVRFEPFGQGNSQPLFLVKNLEIVNVRFVGSNLQHLKLELKSDKMKGKIFKAIGFRLADGNGKLKAGDKVDIVFELIVDEWNGNRDLQMRIIDLKQRQ